MKIKWKLGDVPTGRYRSFQERSWPMGRLPDGRAVAYIGYTTGYRPALSQRTDLQLEVYVAQYVPDGKFKWRRLKRRGISLIDAKALAQEFLERHPEYLPKEVVS